MASSTESEILEEAAFKHTGAEGGQQGYDFQDFVTVVEIIRIALRTPSANLANVKVAQNAPRSQVDDLHIMEGTKRRHVQIKSDARLSWRKKLVREFRHDRTLFRREVKNLTLELCVRNDDLALTLDRNKANHHLSFVTVTAIDIDWMNNFPSPEILTMLRRLTTVFPSEDELVGLWNQLEGCWTRIFKRRADMATLFARSNLSTGGALRSFARPSDRVLKIAARLKSLAPDLLVSVDGDTIILRDPGIIVRTDLDKDRSNLGSVLDTHPPRSLVETFELSGMIKAGDNDDEDGEEDDNFNH